MPDPITALVGGGLALGGYGAYQQGEAAKDAAGASQQANQWQADLANQQWQRYLGTFAPLEDRLVEEAQAPVENQPGFARMMGTIDRGFSDVAGNTRRTMAGRYPSGSGLEALNQENIEMNRTRAKTGAVGAAMGSRFDRMLQAAGLGRGIPTNVLNTAGNVAGQQGNIAAMQSNAANSAWGGVGNTTGNLMQMYMMSKAGMPTYPGAGTYGVTPSASSLWNTWH